MRLIAFIAVSFVSARLLAQMPETNIYLARIEIKNHLIKFEKAENISPFRTGYDNQPFFTADGKYLLFSSESGISRQVQIMRRRLGDKEAIAFTASTESSKYSPMMAAGRDSISSVLVEQDSVQRIWLFDVKSGERTCLTPNTDSIGYYAWLGKDSILYYKLTDPHSLRVLNLKTGEDNWLCDHPTRSFRQIDGRTIFYVIHGEKENQIFFYDIRIKKATLYAVDKPDNQDYVWLPEFGMVKSEGAKLFRYSTDTKVWVEAADFSNAGITKITRFAFSPDKKHLAVVSNQ